MEMITGEVRSDEDAKAAHFVTLTLDLGADREIEEISIFWGDEAGVLPMPRDWEVAIASTARHIGPAQGDWEDAEPGMMRGHVLLEQGRRKVAHFHNQPIAELPEEAGGIRGPLGSVEAATRHVPNITCNTIRMQNTKARCVGRPRVRGQIGPKPQPQPQALSRYVQLRLRTPQYGLQHTAYAIRQIQVVGPPPPGVTRGSEIGEALEVLLNGPLPGNCVPSARGEASA
jgi:hypothetical protein